VLAASIVLGIMILPTITSIAIDALQAVPRSYVEGSIALGARGGRPSPWSFWRAARSGLVAAVILGMGRAIGETMAVIMVAGNALALPHSPLDPVRTLTSTSRSRWAMPPGIIARRSSRRASRFSSSSRCSTPRACRVAPARRERRVG